MNEQTHFATWIFYTARFWGFIAMLILTSIQTAATKPHPNKTDTTDFPLNRLLEVLENRENTSWTLDHEYDPYNTEQHTLRTDPNNPQLLNLRADQTFMVRDQYDRKEGIWEVDMHQQTITFWCKRVNGEMIQSSQPNTYKVKVFNEHQLILTWQGRHGQVDKVYQLN